MFFFSFQDLEFHLTIHQGSVLENQVDHKGVPPPPPARGLVHDLRMLFKQQSNRTWMKFF